MPALTAALVCVLAAEPAEFRDGLARFEAARGYAEEHPEDRRGIRARYAEAARVWEGLYRKGTLSAELLVNVGNAYHFAGRTGRAVLFWRRALAIDPGNARARDALSSARAGLPIRRPAQAVTTLARALLFWHHGTGLAARKAAFLGIWPAAWLLLLLAVLRRGAWRPLAAAALLVALALLGSLLADAAATGAGDAVILVPAQGRRGDGEAYSPSHSDPFPPGTEVRIREARGSWTEVVLPDGSTSWIPGAALERVIPEA